MSVSGVQKSLSDVERKLVKLNKIADKGAEQLKMGDVLKMATKGNSINSTIQKGLKEFKDVQPSDAESQALYEQMLIIVENEEKQMAFLGTSKPYFDKLHVAGMVKKNIEKSEESASLLAAAMIAKAPADIKPKFEALDKRAKKAFNDVLMLYKGAIGGEDKMDEVVDDSD